MSAKIQVVTRPYRIDSDAPPFGRGTFWTTQREHAQFLAKVEAGTVVLPDPRRLYQAVKPICGEVGRVPMSRLIPFAEGKPCEEALQRLRGGVLREAERMARDKYVWLQLVHDLPSGRELHWRDAYVYMGSKPIDARLAPPELQP